MNRPSAVEVVAHDPSAIVEVVRRGRHGVGHVDGGDGTVRVPQEAVVGVRTIDVLAHDLAAIVDPVGPSLRGAGHVDLPEAAPLQHEAVLELEDGRVSLVRVRADDPALVVELRGQGSLGAGEVDLPEAAPVPEEAMESLAGIEVGAHDLPAAVAAERGRERGAWDIDRDEATRVSHEAMTPALCPRVLGSGVPETDLAKDAWPRRRS